MANTKSGLSKLLSAEIPPLVPETIRDLTLKQYLQNQATYLRRLFGMFTGENIYQTIFQQNNSLILPPVPDKTKTYVLIWNCATQAVEWRYDGISCGTDVPPDGTQIDVVTMFYNGREEADINVGAVTKVNRSLYTFDGTAGGATGAHCYWSGGQWHYQEFIGAAYIIFDGPSSPSPTGAYTFAGYSGAGSSPADADGGEWGEFWNALTHEGWGSATGSVTYDGISHTYTDI